VGILADGGLGGVFCARRIFTRKQVNRRAQKGFKNCSSTFRAALGSGSDWKRKSSSNVRSKETKEGELTKHTALAQVRKGDLKPGRGIASRKEGVGQI